MHHWIIYALLLVVFALIALLFLQINTLSTKTKAVYQFLSGEVFSTEFHKVLDTFFSQQDNIEMVTSRVYPQLFKDIQNTISPAKEEEIKEEENPEPEEEKEKDGL